MADGGTSTRQKAAKLVALAGRADARALPDFLVIGAQKSGTTALFEYLRTNPAVVSPVAKELHYLDRERTWRQDRRYRLSFPSRERLVAVGGPSGRALTGEATPEYLFYADAPPRAAALVPDARLVVLLRDPVERAWSHWRMEVARGWEDLSFEDALLAEEERFARALATGDRRSLNRHSYRVRGLYADQLERWFRWYPRHQVHVERSDDLFGDPGATYDRILGFLRLPHHAPEFAVHRPVAGGRAEDSPLAPGTEDELRAWFEAPNARLAELVGIDFNRT